LTAVEARRLTASSLEALGSTLKNEPRVRVVVAGKAAVGMALAIDQALGASVQSGLITAPTSSLPLPRWRTVAATHPQPGSESEVAGRAALALADRCREDGSLLVVGLSGGASAMLAVPAEGLTIADKAQTTACLLRAGLDIGSTNLVRRHLSARGHYR